MGLTTKKLLLHMLLFNLKTPVFQIIIFLWKTNIQILSKFLS